MATMFCAAKPSRTVIPVGESRYVLVFWVVVVLSIDYNFY